MANFKYTPDEEITIHKVQAIRHMCSAFLSHENGLPELVKNSAAAYLREGRGGEDCVIVVTLANAKPGRPATIGCLDFVGMTSEQIEKNFRFWADPNAADRSGKLRGSMGELGGHGNGGKCYLTQMFKDHAVLHTVRGDSGCCYGVKGGSVAFGYVPNPSKGRDFRVMDIQRQLQTSLQAGHTTCLLYTSPSPRD